MENFETILDKARKIQALADKGYAGEADAAKLILIKYLAKYGFTLEDLNQEQTADFDFTVIGNLETRLFQQIIYFVLGSRECRGGFYRGVKHKKWLTLTPAQYIRISELFEFHKRNAKREFNKMRTVFLSAYCSEHRIFPENHKNATETTIEESMAMSGIGQLIDKSARFHKSLKSTNN